MQYKKHPPSGEYFRVIHLSLLAYRASSSFAKIILMPATIMLKIAIKPISITKSITISSTIGSSLAHSKHVNTQYVSMILRATTKIILILFSSYCHAQLYVLKTFYIVTLHYNYIIF